MFKKHLMSVLDELDRREQKGRDVYKEGVQEKLDRSVENYSEELKETCNYILSKNPISVIKQMNKNNKRKKDKEEETY